MRFLGPESPRGEEVPRSHPGLPALTRVPALTRRCAQTTRGHQFLKKNFGETAIPRGTWQIDPFGHSNTEAWLLGAESGFESLFWGRTDYQDMQLRTSPAGQANNQWPEWVWQGSQSLGKSAELFAGELTTGGYGAPIGWDQGRIVILSRFSCCPSR